MASEIPSPDTIVCAAVDIDSEANRLAYIAGACGDDCLLRARVEKLVAAHFRAGNFLEEPAGRLGATGPFTHARGDEVRAFREGAGTMIGPYKLLEQIGEGGFGVVFLAEQQEPIRRQVALKLLKPGMDSKQVIARFEAERQALALLDHPNIARVLDAGTTESGRPFFVMELVKGVPITDSCDREQLTPRQRLELCIPVCQAVQYAHTKGIIHRDIKPSNVLVTLHDGTPVPKVIDFGIAKALGQDLTDKALFTGFAQMIGTPLYMSPEQAGLSGLDVDTRSDVYSLGVLVYELLTGTTPFDRDRFRKADCEEIRRIIREEEPPRPSARLSPLGQDSTTLSARRKTDPRRLSQLFHGEVDWIVMKCLEKDRNRRYETASALALDLQRYLHDEPVLAGPPSTAYRLRKFLKRHQGPVLVAAIVLLALLGGIVGTTAGLVRAEGARQEAVQAEEKERGRRHRAEEAHRQETLERERADQETRIALAVREFLQMKLLGQADTRVQADALLGSGGHLSEVQENPTIRELLDRAARELTPDRIEDGFPRQPLVQGEILQTIGDTYRGIGEYVPAIAHLKRSHALRQRHLGADHRVTLIVLNNLALAHLGAVDLLEATRLFEHLRARVIAKRGLDDPFTLAVLNNLAGAYRRMGKWPEAIRLHELVRDRQMRQFGPDNREVLSTLNNLALVYRVAGKSSDAVRLLEQVRDRRVARFGFDHPGTLVAVCNLAHAYRSAGNLAEAIRLLEQTRDTLVVKPGPDHPDTLTALNNLAGAYRDAGKLSRAILLYEQVREKRIARLGPDHPITLTTLTDLGLAYQDAGKLGEAIRLHEFARERFADKLGPDHPETLSTSNNLGLAYRAAGKRAEAARLFEQVRDKCTARFGPDHPLSLGALHNLALTYLDARKLPQAVRLLEQARDRFTAKFGPDHLETLTALSNLASAYQDTGKQPESIRLLEQVRDRAIVKFGPDHPLTLNTRSSLAVAYWATKRLDLSVPLFEQVFETQKRKRGPDHPDTLLTMLNLGINYRDAGRLPRALALLEDALKRARKLPAPLPAELAWVPVVLAATCDQAGQFARSEPLYIAFLEQARRQFGANHPRTADALAELGLNQLRQQKHADAERLLRECLAIRERKQKGDWTTSDARSLLGAALLGRAKYADAEPLLVAGYEGMKQRQATIPAPLGNTRLSEARERLVRLYEAWGKKDEAARWRTTREPAGPSSPTPQPKQK